MPISFCNVVDEIPFSFYVPRLASEVLQGSYVAWEEQQTIFPMGKKILSNAKHVIVPAMRLAFIYSLTSL